LNTVKKVRTLYLIGQSRIHVDRVENLGDFLEIEVVLKPEQTLEEGNVIMDNLISKLEIDKSDLIEGAYADLLNNKLIL
jgi:predicted adenylyl cyclase CyaB